MYLQTSVHFRPLIAQFFGFIYELLVQFFVVLVCSRIIDLDGKEFFRLLHKVVSFAPLVFCFVIVNELEAVLRRLETFVFLLLVTTNLGTHASPFPIDIPLEQKKRIKNEKKTNKQINNKEITFITSFLLSFSMSCKI
jgi:hypothetical protein